MSSITADLEALLAQRGALLEGHFRLSSGRHSDRFVQKFRLLEDPALVAPVAEAIAARFRAQRPTLVAGAAIGGIVLAYEVAKQLGTRFVFVEKEVGIPTLRRGFKVDRDDRVLVVEDVVTTGLSVREVVGVVRASGAHVVGIGVVVLRQAQDDIRQAQDVLRQAQDDIRQAQDDIGGDIPIVALLDMPLQSYDEAECPLCISGVPIADPGSRRT